MLVLINFFLIFMFLNTMLHFGIPNVIDNNNYIIRKIIFFAALFYFYFLINSLSKIFRRCAISVKQLMSRSAVIAVSGVLGYGLYQDLARSEYLSHYVLKVAKLNVGQQKLLISGFMMMFIVFVRCMELLITYDDMGCSY